jgi:hypothetical protein
MKELHDEDQRLSMHVLLSFVDLLSPKCPTSAVLAKIRENLNQNVG